MENIDEKLQELAEKNAKKNKQKQKEAANLLASHFAEKGDASYLVSWIMKLHVDTCGLALTECQLDDEGISRIIDAFKKCDEFKNSGNGSSPMIGRGLKACEVFLKADKNKPAVAAFASSVIGLGEKNKTFSEDFFKYFQRFIIDENQLESFMALQEALQKDYEKKKFQFVSREIGKKQNQSLNGSLKEPNDRTETSVSVDGSVNETGVTDSDLMIQKGTASANDAVKSEYFQTAQEIALKEFRALNRSLAEQIEKLTDANGTVATLRIAEENSKRALESKEQEIIVIRQELEQARQSAGSLQLEKSRLEERLQEAEAEISALKERIELAFQMDVVGKKQELETLKKSVSDGLKAEYEEYESKDSALFNEDNFEANRASLQRIFKILKRLGFSFE